MCRSRFRFAFIILAVGAAITSVQADSIFLVNPDGAPALKPFRDNILILRISEKSLVFRTGSGTEQEIELEKIAKLGVTADAALTEADDSYVLRDYEKAVDSYLRAIRTNEAWKLKWITPRLSLAAAKANRLDASLTAFMVLARIDPAVAITAKPSLPDKGSKLLDEAARQLEAAVRTATADSEKQVLLSFLLDVQMKRGEPGASEAVANELAALSSDQSDPRVAAMIVSIRLDQAAGEINAGRFDRVGALIEPIKTRLTLPAQQAQAMFLLAQAARGLSGQDKMKQRDAAIAFLRVAAHFGSVEGKPFVERALLEAAQISQAAGDLESAALLCDQITVEFPGTPSAREAASRLAGLKK